MSGPKPQTLIDELQSIKETPLQQLRNFYGQSNQLESSLLLNAIQRIAAANPELSEQIQSDHLRITKEFSERAQGIAAKASQYLQEVSSQSRQRTTDFLKSPQGRSHLPGQIPLGIPQDGQLPLPASFPHFTLAAYTCVLDHLGTIKPEDFDIQDRDIQPQGCGNGSVQPHSPNLLKISLGVQSVDGLSNLCKFLIRSGAHMNSNALLNDPDFQIEEHDTLVFETGASATLNGKIAVGELATFDPNGQQTGVDQGALTPMPYICLKAELVFSIFDMTRSNLPPVLLGSDSLTVVNTTFQPTLVERPWGVYGGDNLKVGIVLRRSRTLGITIDLALTLDLVGETMITLDPQFSTFYLQPFYFSRQECKNTFVKIRGPWEIELEGMRGLNG